MTEPDSTHLADAKTEALQLNRDAERFVASAPLPGDEPTMQISAAELLRDDDA